MNPLIDWCIEHKQLIGTLGSALATLFFGTFTWLQFQLNSRQSAAQKRMERAYIYVSVDKPRFTEDGDFTVIEAVAQSNNKGKTPALLTQLRGYLVLDSEVPHHLIETKYTDSILSDGLALASGDAFNYPTKIKLSNEEIQAIDNRDRTLYFVGRVRYRDIFDVEHCTSFCWRMQKGYVDYWRFKFAGDSELNALT